MSLVHCAPQFFNRQERPKRSYSICRIALLKFHYTHQKHSLTARAIVQSRASSTANDTPLIDKKHCFFFRQSILPPQAGSWQISNVCVTKKIITMIWKTTFLRHSLGAIPAFPVGIIPPKVNPCARHFPSLFSGSGSILPPDQAAPTDMTMSRTATYPPAESQRKREGQTGPYLFSLLFSPRVSYK